MLLDWNFNVETVVSSDSLLKVNEQLLVLELVIQCTDELRRVTIELNMQEMHDFLSKMATIENELMQASKSNKAASEE